MHNTKTTTNFVLTWLLIAILFAGNYSTSLAAQNAVGEGANGASVVVTATVLGVGANVSVPAVAPVALPPQGGSNTNQVASVNAQLGVAGVMTVLSTGLVVNTTSGNISSSAAHAESSSTVDNLNILNGLVTATTVRARSTSDGNGNSASSNAAGSFLNQLRIGGILREESEFAPNTSIAINASVTAIVGGLPLNVPVNGTIVLNEQLQSGNGTTTSLLTVNYIHVTVSGSVTGLIALNADIVVASATSSVNFTAAATNHPPIINAPGPQTVQAGHTLTFGVSAVDPDVGDIVSLGAANLPSGSTFNPNPATGNPASGQFSFTPVASQAGQTFTVSFTATDNHGAPASGSVQITVTQGPPPANNRPPVIIVPGPQVIEAGNTLDFTVTATDPDGDAVTLSADSVPANASFNANTGGFAFTPSTNQIGQVFVVTFIATDTHGASADGSVRITVVAAADDGKPGPPIISVPPSSIIVPVGTTLTFVVVGTSPDQGCRVTLFATDLPANGLFDPSIGRFNFTPVEQQIGQSFAVRFIATDCVGQTATGTVTIIVVGGGGIGESQVGHICVPVTKISFETTSVNGGCGFIKVSMANLGNGALRIRSMSLVDGTHFRIDGMPTIPVSLQSGLVLELKIMFQPKASGALRDTLMINTDDPDNPTITVELKGKGKR